jgi:hypothetical protein
MLGEWLHDLESLEAISQNDETRRVFLRLAAMSQSGGTDRFLRELDAADEIDAGTKATLAELARDPAFLLVVEDYLRRTQVLH